MESRQNTTLCSGVAGAAQKVSGELPKEGVFQGVGSDGTEHTCFVLCGTCVMEAVKLGCLQ